MTLRQKQQGPEMPPGSPEGTLRRAEEPDIYESAVNENAADLNWLDFPQSDRDDAGAHSWDNQALLDLRSLPPNGSKAALHYMTQSEKSLVSLERRPAHKNQV